MVATHRQDKRKQQEEEEAGSTTGDSNRNGKHPHPCPIFPWNVSEASLTIQVLYYHTTVRLAPTRIRVGGLGGATGPAYPTA